MRARKDIEKDPKQNEFLIVEILLDIRELLQKQTKGQIEKKKKSVEK